MFRLFIRVLSYLFLYIISIIYIVYSGFNLLTIGVIDMKCLYFLLGYMAIMLLFVIVSISAYVNNIPVY